MSISLTLAIPFVLLALRINDVRQAAHAVHRGVRRAILSPRLIPFIGYTALCLLVVVIPSIVWTSRLATTAKVALTVCLAVGLLVVIIAVGIKRLVDITRRPLGSSTDLGTRSIVFD